MSLLKMPEISRGNADHFAFAVAFHPDPDGGECATPEEASSWGSFQIWAKGQNLCLNRDEDFDFDSINWYLLPIFEWLTDHWDVLFREESLCPASDEEWYDWWSTHCLLACSEGGLFPYVTFERRQEDVKVSWEEIRLAGQPDCHKFLCGEGSEIFSPKAVMEVFHGVLEEAAEFLSNCNPESEQIHRLIGKIRDIKSSGGF